MKIIGILLILICFIHAEPVLSSWNLDGSRQYARIYKFESDVTNQAADTTWDRDTATTNGGNGEQLEPAYAGIHEVSYDNDFVYLRTTGMGAHVMGPWWQNRSNSTADNAIFINWPGSVEIIVSIPRLTDPSFPTIPVNRTDTTGGAIGLFVDGVSMFDSRDAFSYDSSAGVDEQPGSAGNISGDDYWERDAYINEGQTFDSAFAHAANEQYHYHANPPALRHRLGDSVDYDPVTNTYSENFNGNHSPILGWVRDGLPIYGPYGYSDPDDANSSVRLMVSGYQMRTDLSNNGNPRNSYPAWATRLQGALPSGFEGPNVSAQFPRGHYLQDYEYLGDLGQTLGSNFDLDEFNTRFCVTPEFPNGVRAYFVSIESDGTPKFPYNIGRQYYSNPTGGSYNNSDARANNDFTTPPGLTVYAEGGPESAPKDLEISTNSSNGDVTLTWTGVEGGTYELSSDTDLSELEEIQDKTISTLTNGEPVGEITDFQILNNEPRKFYQIGLESVAPFDDSGLQLDSVSIVAQNNPITITLNTNGPADLTIFPNSIIVDGEAVEIIDRPTANQVTILFNPNSLTTHATLQVTFPGNTAVLTGTIAAPSTSNVLFILIDDWGIDSSPLDNPTGTDLPLMPNFVAHANESVRFKNTYVSPTCSPTRMAVMSGRHPSSNGVGAPGATVNARDSSSIMTIAEAIDHPTEGVAYTSGLIGKWHLGNGTDPNTGGQGPKADGWDHFLGSIAGNVADYSNWLRQDIDENITNQAGSTSNETNYATTVNVDDALAFTSSNTNWLCWVAFNAPHGPFHLPPFDTNGDLVLNGETYPIPVSNINNNRERYKAMLWALDSEIGRLLNGVDLNTTTVIILGDNGTPANVIGDENLFPANHGKGFIYEGGVRVPLLIRPAGGTTSSVSTELVNAVDLFPTFCDLIGIDSTALGEDLDGISLLPIINGTDTADRYAVAETFQNAQTGISARTIRKDNYKLNIYDDPEDADDTPSLEFFDLDDGLDENPSNNLLLNTLTTVEQTAYDNLIAHNVTLNTGESIQYATSTPPANSITTNNANFTGITGSNNNNTNIPIPPLTNTDNGNNIDIISITVGGIAATNTSRTSNGTTPNQNWVTFDFDESSSGLATGSYDIVVSYNPANNPRVFTMTNGYSHP